MKKTKKQSRLVASFQEGYSSLNPYVFWPPFLLLFGAVVFNFTQPDLFLEQIRDLDNRLLTNFGWMFSLCAFAAVLLCVGICFSNFSSVRIGGRDAKPLMSLWNWFAITVCTTIAVGILFWATAEPIYHFRGPPESLGLIPRSQESAKFAMSAMYLHWTFTPYAIYCVASLTFAFVYYNMKRSFSLGSTLSPLLGRWIEGPSGKVIDAICLYSLVAGMAASLGTGILTISGGLTELFNAPSNPLVWAIIAIAIVSTFIVSSATGLMKGIRILSDINTKALFGLAAIAFVVGPTVFILSFGLESFGVYLNRFFEMNLFTGVAAVEAEADPWPQQWTIFYWAVWLAWAPITACFLGRIAYGRTVREFMLVNFICPALFGAFWMAIFSGTALHMELKGAGLEQVLETEGARAIAYEVFRIFPFAIVVIGFYVLSAFICFVTSADSNTSAMASICSTGISPDNPEGNIWIKIIWGITVGMVAWVMISFGGQAATETSAATDGTEGIKIISRLGGFPAAILEFFIFGSLLKIIFNHAKLSEVD